MSKHLGDLKKNRTPLRTTNIGGLRSINAIVSQQHHEENGVGVQSRGARSWENGNVGDEKRVRGVGGEGR